MDGKKEIRKDIEGYYCLFELYSELQSQGTHEFKTRIRIFHSDNTFIAIFKYKRRFTDASIEEYMNKALLEVLLGKGIVDSDFKKLAQ